MIRAVAYCRVSTNKEEQLDSLEAQQQFFSDYAEKMGIAWFIFMPMKERAEPK